MRFASALPFEAAFPFLDAPRFGVRFAFFTVHGAFERAFEFDEGREFRELLAEDAAFDRAFAIFNVRVFGLNHAFPALRRATYASTATAYSGLVA